MMRREGEEEDKEGKPRRVGGDERQKVKRIRSM